MPWLTDRHCFWVAVIFYGAGMLHSIFLWKKGFRQHDHWSAGLLSAGLIFHTRAMALRGMSLHHCPVNNLFETFAFVLWTLALAALAAAFIPRLRFLAAFAAPVVFSVGVFALMPSLDAPYGDKPELHSALRSLHAALSMLSYGAFGLAAAAAAMFLTQERDLKRRHSRALLSLLPPMERLEKIMTWMSVAGIILLTVGMALTPVLIVQQKTDTKMTNDPKVLWAMGVWACYGALWVRHKVFGLTGRRFAWGLIGLFAFVMLTFWGMDLLSPVHKV